MQTSKKSRIPTNAAFAIKLWPWIILVARARAWHCSASDRAQHGWRWSKPPTCSVALYWLCMMASSVFIAFMPCWMSGWVSDV
jgi:hypothetical protein